MDAESIVVAFETQCSLATTHDILDEVREQIGETLATLPMDMRQRAQAAYETATARLSEQADGAVADADVFPGDVPLAKTDPRKVPRPA